MTTKELRQQVINLIWEKGVYTDFCSQDIETRARGIRLEVSSRFIDETFDKMLQKGAIQERVLTVSYTSTGCWYKFLKDTDQVSAVQKTATAMHHDYIVKG